MLRNILIGLDGSEYSKAAVDLSVEWSKKFGCMIVGIGVIDEPGITAPKPIPIGGGGMKESMDSARLKEATTKVEKFLSDFSLRCSKEQVPFKLLEDVGNPSDEIVREAQRYDLIMLGQQTYFEFETQSSPGATLETLLRLSPRPVVAVPAPMHRGSTTMIAYDGSIQAARAVENFVHSGLAALGPVHVVTGNKDKVEAARIGDRAVEYLAAHDVKAELHAIDKSGKANMILEQAASLDAGLLVMGAYGKSYLRELVLGSKTRAVIQKSTIPLFLYH